MWANGKAEVGRVGEINVCEEVESHEAPCFSNVLRLGESKSRLANAAGAKPSGEMRNQKLPAVVARSTFGSSNAKITSLSKQFWKLRCRTLLWREAHLEVKIYKTHPQWTALLRKARFEVKTRKTHHIRSTFGRRDDRRLSLSSRTLPQGASPFRVN